MGSSYPVAHVGSRTKKGDVIITGAPAHMVGGSGGGEGYNSEFDKVQETVGMETEDMTPEERRKYLDEKFGPGSADAYDRANGGNGGPDSDPGAEPGTPSTARSTPVGCEGMNGASDSTKISRYFTVGMLSSGIYQSSNAHAIPSITVKGLGKAEVMCNLKHIAVNTLDPLTDWLKKAAPDFTFKVGSAFRNQSGSSDHNIGSATDLHFFKAGRRATREELHTIAKRVMSEAGVPYTQFLLEFSGSGSAGWLHLANRRSGQNSAMRIGYSFNNGGDFHAGFPKSA